MRQPLNRVSLMVQLPLVIAYIATINLMVIGGFVIHGAEMIGIWSKNLKDATEGDIKL